MQKRKINVKDLWLKVKTMLQNARIYLFQFVDVLISTGETDTGLVGWRVRPV